MADLGEKMFSAREVPWHFAMTKDRTLVTDDNLTMEEAIPASGLDWTVSRVPVFTHDDHDGFTVIPERIAIRRDTDRSILGLHTEGYQENQPHELFRWGWDIIEASTTGGLDTSAIWETGGSLAGGKRIFAMIKLPETIEVDGDKHVPYLGLADSYDGTLALRAWLTYLRIVCQNTLDWSWSEAIRRIAIRHTRNSKDRIAAARHALDLSYSNMAQFQREAEQLMNQAVTDNEFYNIVNRIFPEQKDETDRQKRNRQRRRRTVTRIYHDSPTVGVYRGTAWGAINAVQEWEQWSARGVSSKKTQRDVQRGQMQRLMAGSWPATIQTARLLVPR